MLVHTFCTAPSTTQQGKPSSKVNKICSVKLKNYAKIKDNARKFERGEHCM